MAQLDLDSLAGLIGDSLQDPTYALAESEGFVRFETTADVTGRDPDTMNVGEITIRATVTSASDGEDPITDAVGEVVEIVVRRAVSQ
jgi:hypothetical protein